MSFYDQDHLFVQSVLVFSDRVRELSGAEWADVRPSLLEPLTRAEEADDERELRLALDDFASAMFKSPATRLGWSLMAGTRYGAVGWPDDDVVVFVDPTNREARHTRVQSPLRFDFTSDHLRLAAHALKTGLERVDEPAFSVTTVMDDAMIDAVWAVAPAAEPSPPAAPVAEAPVLAPPRYLNTGLFRMGESQPMTAQESPPPGRYEVGVNVGAFWGPGAPDAVFPDELIQAEFEARGVLRCQLSVVSAAARVENGSVVLPLPREGDTPLRRFPVTFEASGTHAVDAHLFYEGNLLQSRRLEVEVSRVRDAPGTPTTPAQEAYVVFSRTESLGASALARLQENPRRMTIVAGREATTERIVIRFYQGAADEALAQVPTELTSQNLTTAVTRVRKQLKSTMEAYTGDIGGPPERLEEHLGRLAYVGRSFYLALVPESLQLRTAEAGGAQASALEPGSIIQVGPLSPQLSVPWETLYERPVEKYRKGTTRLCQSYAHHGLKTEDCPYHEEPEVVCPYGFWGYRYIVEQLPGQVERGEAARTLAQLVANAGALRLTAFIHKSFLTVQTHLENLQALASSPPLTIVPVDSFELAKKTLKQEANSISDVLYFFTHGGRDEFGAPCLAIGVDDLLSPVDLESWKIQLPRHPLLVLNACESAGYTPDDFENLIRFFIKRGAAGVVATQCDVKELLAGEAMVTFLGSFLSKVPAGKALFAARSQLLRKGDPRGLAYSLFASADVVLEEALAA